MAFILNFYCHILFILAKILYLDNYESDQLRVSRDSLQASCDAIVAIIHQLSFSSKPTKVHV